jgi:siroheme synthase-like protein
VKQAYPLMLAVSGLQIVIVGGGAVAARKAAGLFAAGARRIRVVSPDFPAEFPEGIDRLLRCYHPQDLQDADLVFAATNSTAVNDAVVSDANALGIWVNRADGSDTLPGDFSTPAKFEFDAITVTVSAGSPALAAMIRDGLKQRFDPAWAAMADAMKILRPLVLSSGLDAAKRAEIFHSLATAEAIEILRNRGIHGLKEWIARQS